MSQGDSRTLGDELIAAKQAMEDAERAFREMLVQASNRGASVRDIARLIGVPHTTVWRWMEGYGKRRERDVLGQPR